MIPPHGVTKPDLRDSHVILHVELAVDDGVVQPLTCGRKLAGELVLVLVDEVESGLG